MVLSEEALRFAEKYSEITENKKYRELASIARHGSTNTYDHSIRVGEMAYRLAPSLGVNPDSAARVGLLHDFCMVDYNKPGKDPSHGGRYYMFYHPEDAVINSEGEGFELSEKEQRAIRTHMFPFATAIPTSKLGYLLVLCDKVVATIEVRDHMKESFYRLKYRLSSPMINN